MTGDQLISYMFSFLKVNFKKISAEVWCIHKYDAEFVKSQYGYFAYILKFSAFFLYFFLF